MRKLTKLLYFVNIVLILVVISFFAWELRGRYGKGLPPKDVIQEVINTAEQDGQEKPIQEEDDKNSIKDESGSKIPSQVQARTMPAIGIDGIEKEMKRENANPVVKMVNNKREEPGDFHAGMALIVYENDYKSVSELEHKLQSTLERMIDNNINSISVNIPLFQENYRASEVLKKEGLTPGDEEIALIVESAKERGFSVMIRPFLDEESISYDASGRYTGKWRGNIEPRNVEAWFASYEKILVSYAKLAQETGADSIAVGTELTSMEERASYWKDIIAEVRQRFGGELTYSSNSGVSEYIPWGMLDFISVDAFFYLDIPEDAEEADIEKAWQHWIKQVSKEAEMLDKPLVLTELGTTSQKGSFIRSWLWDHKTSLNLEAQRMYYSASCRAWYDSVKGIYWWAANLWMPEDPKSDAGFTPLGKTAEKEIALCFKD